MATKLTSEEITRRSIEIHKLALVAKAAEALVEAAKENNRFVSDMTPIVEAIAKHIANQK